VGTYIIRRLLLMIPTVLLLVLIVVVMIRMIPGNIVDLLLEESGAGGAGQLDRQMIEERLGLNRPIYQEYVDYVLGLVRGDLGNSLWDQRPVRDAIWDRVPVTMEVALIAIAMSVIVSIPIGVISAVRQDTFFDYLLRSISVLGISVPNFAIGTAIVVFPAIWWGWSVSFRYVTFAEDPIKHLTIVFPPAAVLGIQLSASVARMTRAMMLEVLQEDYIRTARAKGLHEFRVVSGHALKNALIPVVTLLGLQVTFLIGGSVITETIFALPGLGRLLLEAIGSRDYPIVQGIVVVIGTFVIFVNLLVDLSYGLLDPRVKAA
jgi:peptide/nickel transport system permease protein